jgi:hypothetical protein
MMYVVQSYWARCGLYPIVLYAEDKKPQRFKDWISLR